MRTSGKIMNVLFIIDEFVRVR